MNGAWAVLLPRKSLYAAGRLRRVPGVRVCEQVDAVWLHGDALDEALERSLRALPGARRFSVIDGQQLVPEGRIVPRGYLPEGPWAPLAQWLTVELGPAALAGRLHERLTVRLVRSPGERVANVLLTSLETWKVYGAEAPRVRLDRWTFAVSDAGEVVIRGTPLPPVPGRPFIEDGGVAVPAGYAWEPAVDAAVLREALGLGEGDLALLHPDGPWDRVPADGFVKATRSAIRLSGGETADA